MKPFILKYLPILTGLAACILIGGITMSFQDNNIPKHPNVKKDLTLQDTLPGKRYENTMSMKEFDILIRDLDKDMLHVTNELKKIDFSQIQRQVELSLRDVNIEKIMSEVEQSIANIDVTKIMADVKNSLDDINWDEKNVEIKKALADAKVEIEKAKLEIRELNSEDIRKELEEAKREIEKTKLELKSIDMDKIMAKAKEGIDEAKKELKQTRKMFEEMEKDGLINMKAGFSIEYKDKELIINDIKQKPQITDKYRKYFTDDHFKIKISKE